MSPLRRKNNSMTEKPTETPTLHWSEKHAPGTTPEDGSQAAKTGVPAEVKQARERTFWFDARTLAPEDDLHNAAAQNGFDRWLIQPEQTDAFRERRVGMGLTVEIKEEGHLAALQPGDIALSTSPDLLKGAKAKGNQTALWVTISDAPTLEYASKAGRDVDFLITELIDETNIPLELVVAELQNDGTIVLKAVPTAEDAGVAFGVVEYGADGALLQTTKAQELIAVGALKRRQKRQSMQLQRGTITRVKHLGMGHRACVDVVSLMTPKEGMLVGCTSTGGVLACSETHPLPYMDLRPFRVNAGAIHSYIWCPDNRTHYLSELKAGSKLLCVDIQGRGREVIVGRVKTEIRPLLLLEAEVEDVTVSAILQDDWHVRVYNPQGEPVSVTTFQPGDPILCYTTTPGRHVGISVKEQIIER